MRKIFISIILIILSSQIIFAQDIEQPFNYEQSKFVLDFNYIGFPFFINIGYMYRKNSSQVFFPLIGASYEFTEWGFNMFGNAGMKYRYKRFYFNIEFKQGVIPFVVDDVYRYRNLESYGNFTVGHSFENINIFYRLNIGNQYAQYIENNATSNIFQINQSIGILSTLYNDAAHNELSLIAFLGVESMPYNNQHSYNLSMRMPYTFNHYWGELGIMPVISYSEYFGGSQRDYNIGSTYINSLIMLPVATGDNTVSERMLYNFMSYVHIEYRFFLRFLPDMFKSIFLVAYGDIGYGKQVNETFDNGEMLYTYGGGVGFSLFGFPMQVTVGVDNLDRIVIGMFVSPIMHMF